MTNRRPDLVETSGGWEPHTSGGERILVALAGVALLGGVLIVGSNLLKHHDEVSIPSASPSPTSQPRGTPSPTPSPQELALTPYSPLPGASPSQPAPQLFGGWIRAAVDLPVRSDASATAAVVGTLKAGGLAYVDEQDTSERDLAWATVEAPSPTGWVAMRAGGKDLVKRYQQAGFPWSGSLNNLAAGDHGFVALGQSPGGPNVASGSEIYVSQDGITWRTASDSVLGDSYPTGIAWGPAGWILVGSGGRGSGADLWRSPDGDHWTWLGTLEGSYADGLTGSATGYLLETSPNGGYRGQAGRSWFSTDGIHWTESRTGLSGQYRTTATSVGFYARGVTDCCPSTASTTAAFSIDGLTWTPTRPNLFVVTVGSSLLGIEPDATGRGARAMRGSYYRGQLGWREVSGGQVPFINAVVTSVVSDGQHATAFGWDASTEAPLTWTSDGGSWFRNELPAAFGGPPQVAAAGAQGVVAVGYRTNWRGPNPVVWHRDSTSSWEPEPSPVMNLPAEPSMDACGTPPTDPTDFSNLDRAAAVACFGTTPMTVRMWSASCNGCSGQAGGTYEEEWLAAPTLDQLYLCPIVWPDNCWTSAVLAPTLTPVSEEPSWLNAWLDVTGHFDDPASTSCHWNPPPDQLQYYPGVRQTIDACRQQFVVTAIRVVKGP